MKYIIIFIGLLLIIGALSYYYFIRNPYLQHKPVGMNGKVEYMTIKSPVFENNQPIPTKYTCDAENINFPLEINNIPFGTKSMVLIMDDPDSPSKDFTHWVMFNIDPYTTTIGENFYSDNVTLGTNDFGNTGYGGPCPVSGNHRYRIKLYALNSILLLQKGATKAQVLSAMKSFIIEESPLSGTYKRN